MIKPIDNWKALICIHHGTFFPPLRLLRCSMLARQCAALIRADRYLAESDRRPS